MDGLCLPLLFPMIETISPITHLSKKKGEKKLKSQQRKKASEVFLEWKFAKLAYGLHVFVLFTCPFGPQAHGIFLPYPLRFSKIALSFGRTTTTVLVHKTPQYP